MLVSGRGGSNYVYVVANMVALGIFLVAQLLPLFIVIPYIMNIIVLIGIITLFLGATLALAQKDIK